MKTFKRILLGPVLWSIAALQIAAADGTWYAGDLHSHSLHSDGDSPVEDVIASAEASGLDFFALTDHDGNMDGEPTQWFDPAYTSRQMVLLYGVEWTTGEGHANVWAHRPFNYGPLWRANRNHDAERAVAAAHARGALFSINHPTAYLCCPWDYDVPQDVDAIEVWNAMYRLPNLNRLGTHRFWDDQLRAGRRITAVGGSDTHNLKGLQSWLFGHGNPTTWVYAEEHSASAILDGIAAGHVCISYAPDAPRLTFSATELGSRGDTAMMGDNLPANVRIGFTAKVVEANSEESASYPLSEEQVRALATGELDVADIDEGGALRLLVAVKNGEPFWAWRVKGEARVYFADTPEPGDYYRLELRSRDDVRLGARRLLYGGMVSLTNPIYFGFE